MKVGGRYHASMSETTPADDAKITGSHVDELASVDAGDYWWYAVREEHVAAALSRRAAGGDLRLLDFGCGPGGAFGRLTARLAPARALGVDGTAAAIEVARGRGLDVQLADVEQPLALPFQPNAITALDVLEHLDDPVAALRHLAHAAAADARLVVTVPAHRWLWSSWDTAAGHRRRYTRPLLRAHLEQGGWTPVRCRHVFSWCVPPAWWQRVVRREVGGVEFPPVSPLLNRLMRAAGRAERLVGAPLPFGTSLIAVASRR